MTKKKKAIIVGSGISGIAAAIRLNKKGYETHIYEANSYAGGKIREINKDGYRFDMGPSLLTKPDLLNELFELENENIKNYIKIKKLDEICKYFFNDKTSVVAYSNTKKFASECAKKFNINEKKIIKFLNKSKYIYDNTSFIFLEKSLHKISSFLSFKVLKSFLLIPTLNIFRTMNSVNQKIFKNKNLIQIFNRYATYNGSNPYKASAILNVIPHYEFNIGAYFPSDGIYSIISGLSVLAKKKGVKFHFNTRVDEIIYSNYNKIIGVKIGQKIIDSDIVVSNMDIINSYKKLLPKINMPKNLICPDLSTSAIIFYWGVKKTNQNLKLHNILFSSNYKEEFYNMDKNIINTDPTIYINISSKENLSDAPIHCENWFVMINVKPFKDNNWDKIVNDYREIILKKIKKVLKIEIKNFIEYEKISDPREIELTSSSFMGSLYGPSSNKFFSAFLRHPNFSSIKNLYFCGGSVHPGGGIPLALYSAKIVDNLIKI